MEEALHEGALTESRLNEGELISFLTENEFTCVGQKYKGSGQVGRIYCFGSGAIISLYSSGKALIQGKLGAPKKQELRELLRAAKWNVKT